MQVGDLCVVNTMDSHSTSHEGELVVVQVVGARDIDGKLRCSSVIRAYNLNRQRVHDYFNHELAKVDK